MSTWKDSIKLVPKNILFQLMVVLIFLIPLIATLGQYVNSNFLLENVPVQILFWPGVTWEWSIIMPVWLITSVFAITYLFGIVVLLRNRNLGIVALWGIFSMIIANLVAAPINYLAGWSELQVVNNMDLAGKVNIAILSLWHNPLWEEVVFRGLPLFILLFITNKYERFKSKANLIYIIVPSIIFGLYHIPNHGMSRIIDTFILGVILAWLTLKYTFFAPVILHYIFDAIMTLSLSKMPNIPKNEVRWLAENSWVLNTSFSVSIILLLILIPIVTIWNKKRLTKAEIISKDENIVIS